MKVSVCIVTFNHERYIGEALESVLAQKTDYELEVIIGEDCSTDNTRAILLDYQKKYPNIVKLVLQRRNVGPHKNLADVIKRATGTYIALLDGDDFWTSADKLQKQSDMLDARPELSMCFHRGTSFDVDNPAEDFDLPYPPEKPTYTLHDLLTRKNFIFTHSTMLRGKYFRALPRLSRMANAADYTLYIVSAHHGDIGFIPENMCQHRRHKDSWWFGVAMKDVLRNQLRSAKDFETIDRYYHRRYASQLQVAAYYFELANSAFASDRLPEARECLRGVIRSIRWEPALNRGEVLDLMKRVEMRQSLSLRDRLDFKLARFPLP